MDYSQSHTQWYCHLVDLILLLNYFVSESLCVAPTQQDLNVNTLAPVWRQLEVPSVKGKYEPLKNKLLIADLRRRKATENRMSNWNDQNPEVWKIEEDLVFVFVSRDERCVSQAHQGNDQFVPWTLFVSEKT